MLTLVFVGVLCYDYHASCQEEDLRVYQRGKNQAIMVREGRTAAIVSNDSTFAETVTHDYRLARHVSRTTYFPLESDRESPGTSRE